jgi:hypothetical protein
MVVFNILYDLRVNFIRHLNALGIVLIAIRDGDYHGEVMKIMQVCWG